MDESKWTRRLELKRRGKDRFFGDHPRSPLTTADRRGFEGLRYFPVDPAMAFELPLHEHQEKELVTVQATHGTQRTLLRWGEFRFSLGNRPVTLQAYRTEPESERLFVPFRDATSGGETYPFGRYLDLEPEIHRRSDGDWVLDFNEAYNPWCEYSQDFQCPFAPGENWLPVPIRAGEKRFALQEVP